MPPFTLLRPFHSLRETTMSTTQPFRARTVFPTGLDFQAARVTARRVAAGGRSSRGRVIAFGVMFGHSLHPEPGAHLFLVTEEVAVPDHAGKHRTQ